MMSFEPVGIAGAAIVRLDRHTDARGSFARTWCAEEFEQAGIVLHPVQGSVSTTRIRGTIRGMHFQRAPAAEAKLVRCDAGRIWDVITDLRPHSPTYRSSFGLELGGDEGPALYVPAGCAHGYQTLTDGVSVEYLMDTKHAAELADGFRYDDPNAAIAWPLKPVLVAERDLAWPPLSGRSFWPVGDGGERPAVAAVS